MAASPRPVIVCLSSTDWGCLRYRKQHLMERLSRQADVVYVNPPHAIKAREWPFRRRTTRLSSSLLVHEPFVVPGSRRTAWASQATDRWLAARLRRWRGRRPCVLWLYSPHGLAMVDLLRPETVVYDVADLHATPSGPTLRDEGERRAIERLAQLEEALLARADLTLCASEPLLERLAPRTRRARLVPNGCDWTRFAGPCHQEPSAGPVRIGYVGTLAPRFDAELVAEVARLRPEWIIELVGPALPRADVSPLAARPNVLLSGDIPVVEVPGKLATFDVCLLPLREIDFAYYCSPIQVFDYLAAGKPVVSTPVGQLERWPELVRVARGPAAFVGQVEQALAERTPAHVLARRAFAARNSWDIRVAQVCGALAEIGVHLGRNAGERVAA